MCSIDASKHLKSVLKSDNWKEFAVKYKELSNDILNEIYGDSD